MNDILNNNGFWFALGLFCGIIIDVLARETISWWRRPILRSPVDEDEPKDFEIRVHHYCSTVSGQQRVGQERVAVWRLKVANEGCSAAENVRGTVIPIRPDGLGVEQRIPWHESPRNSITLNRGDHSFLDLFGVRLGDGIKNEICLPTEEGWGTVGSPIYGFDIEHMPNFRLRVTAKNCSPLQLDFHIDPSQGCRPVLERK